MNIIEALRQWLSDSPVFAAQRLDIDCLASDPESYSIDSVPSERIVKRYCDGATVRRQLFTVSSRAPYGQDLSQQRENIELFEELESWIDDQEELGVLPPLGERRRARSVKVLSSAYPIEVEDGDQASTARYQIQLELIYLQEVKPHETE